MALVKFVTFVILKILENLVSMKNLLNANSWKIRKTVQPKLTLILNILSEFSIHFTQLSIVIAKKNVGIFK